MRSSWGPLGPGAAAGGRGDSNRQVGGAVCVGMASDRSPAGVASDVALREATKRPPSSCIVPAVHGERRRGGHLPCKAALQHDPILQNSLAQAGGVQQQLADPPRPALARRRARAAPAVGSGVWTGLDAARGLQLPSRVSQR